MKRYLLSLIFTSFVLSPLIFSQSLIFSDYFDQYIAGQMLACQNQVDWTTWSNAPCGPEDAMVDSTHYSSLSRSVLIRPGNDLVKPIANLTGGNYSVVFKFYIPASKTGYFNILQLYSGNNSQWGFEAFFNADGTGYINAGGENTATFNYTHDMWNTLEVKANMADTNDIGAFYINGSVIHTWAWSTGATGTGNLEQLGGVDFYGSESTNEMYIDNFQLWNNGAITGIEDPGITPVEFSLYQNYPNPFNPSTVIKYSIPEAGDVSLSVYNTLGENVAVLREGYSQPGTYELTFNASGLPSGIYFYKLQSAATTITKKMLLLK